MALVIDMWHGTGYSYVSSVALVIDMWHGTGYSYVS